MGKSLVSCFLTHGVDSPKQLRRQSSPEKILQSAEDRIDVPATLQGHRDQYRNTIQYVLFYSHRKPESRTR